MARVYSETEIVEKLLEYPDWSLTEEGQIQVEYEFKNFSQAVFFLNSVAMLAENANHHPDLQVHSYNKLAIQLRTHNVNGITDQDFKLMMQIHDLNKRVF
jgi:4a-hydroxytetrahydrobiopterin dehydratase